MKYDDRYIFNGLSDFEAHGMWWGEKSPEHTCWICKERTKWINLNFQCHICSDECQDYLTFRYMFSDVTSSMMSDIRHIRHLITDFTDLDSDLSEAREVLQELEDRIEDIREHLPNWITKLLRA